MKEKIAFVVQRYGAEVNGGAEAECRMYAEHLVPYYEVEVLTTCAVEHMTWRNEYPAGVSELNGVTVRRFPTDAERNLRRFSAVCPRVASPQPHSDEDEELFRTEQGPLCEELMRYLREHDTEYKAVFFTTYLFWTTTEGLKNCPTRAFLVPTAHDEWPIHLRLFRETFALAEGYVYNSPAEKRFVDRMFLETCGKPSVTVGAGVTAPEGELPDVKERFGLEGDYVLYAGRIESAKGCEELFDYFAAYKKRWGGEVKLALIGKAAMAIPKREDIVHLGFVSEEEKYALMRSAKCFILASQFESLSIVVLESLMMGRPVLVNGRCEVLRDHAVKSQAGLWFNTEQDFIGALHWLLTHPDECALMGRRGQRYTREYYSWSGIVTRLRALIETEL